MDDPYVDTADPGLMALARSATQTGPIQPITPSSAEMGFRGFLIEAGDQVADLPIEIEVRDGQVIYLTDTGFVARQDVLGLGSLVEGMAISSFGWGCLIHDRCRADMNCDGGVTVDDLLEYLVPFIDGIDRADVDDGSSTGTPDGGVTIDDLLYFLVRYEAGC